MKKILCFLLLISSLCGCSKKQEYYKADFMGPFDTLFTVIMYEKSEDDFEENFDFIYDEFTHYHQLYDKYNNYDGLNNIKTINDNAGIEPVVVDKDLYELIETSIDYYHTVSNKVDITLGPVLEIWHHYRELNDGSLPSTKELKDAYQWVGIENVVLNEEEQSVYLPNKNMSLDIGAIAKGYACELVKNKLIEKGLDDFLISAGGNVVSYGKRAVEGKSNQYLPATKDYYGVSLESPKTGAYENITNILMFIVDGDSAVTSGDYQRYFVGNDGKMYHHLIDPTTLYPANYCRSVTILTEDSGLADFLSSSLFLMSVDDGLKVINSIKEDVQVIWLMEDGVIQYTNGLVEGENIHVYD